MPCVRQTVHVHPKRLQKAKFKCPACGGDIGDKPLHQITRSVLQKLQGEVRAPQLKPEVIQPLRVGPRQGAQRDQLVLQFRGGSLSDFDLLISLEDKLIAALGDSADVDGHDIGSDETNIFIFASDPNIAFVTVKSVLEKANYLIT